MSDGREGSPHKESSETSTLNNSQINCAYSNKSQGVSIHKQRQTDQRNDNKNFNQKQQKEGGLRKDVRFVYIGFDNSERNKDRQSIGSCTDKVATERLFFGPWQTPHPGRQKKLVGRLALPKLPAPPDPRFNSWINHFQHYWNIGLDVKPNPRAVRHPSHLPGNCSGDPPVPANDSRDSESGFYVSSYHRLLSRPQTTKGRVPTTDNEDKNQVGGVGAPNDASGYPKLRNMNFKVVPGLDRRYLGLKSVRKEDLEKIVRRVTRMTSAYNAKFAPNPHVWIDKSPGAHMIEKRGNTIS